MSLLGTISTIGRRSQISTVSTLLPVDTRTYSGYLRFMANTDITRYDLEHECYEDPKMVQNHSGDYVEYADHLEIVEALQTELDAARKAIADCGVLLAM